MESIRILDLQPDLVHVNDWQTGLIPALLKCEYHHNPMYENIASLITVHNLAYQGSFAPEQMSLTGLDWKHFNYEQMEFFGRLNLLKTGLVFADAINTVSPTYANEIQTPEQGCGLESVLQHRAADVSGIINGIDDTQWNPAIDGLIPHKFDINSWPAGKAACKKQLQSDFRLDENPDVPQIRTDAWLFGPIGSSDRSRKRHVRHAQRIRTVRTQSDVQHGLRNRSRREKNGRTC
jgi:starch synthase